MRKLNLELGRGFAWAEGCSRDASHAIRYPAAVVTVAPFDGNRNFWPPSPTVAPARDGGGDGAATTTTTTTPTLPARCRGRDCRSPLLRRRRAHVRRGSSSDVTRIICPRSYPSSALYRCASTLLRAETEAKVSDGNGWHALGCRAVRIQTNALSEHEQASVHARLHRPRHVFAAFRLRVRTPRRRTKRVRIVANTFVLLRYSNDSDTDSNAANSGAMG